MSFSRPHPGACENADRENQPDVLRRIIATRGRYYSLRFLHPGCGLYRLWKHGNYFRGRFSAVSLCSRRRY